jgi:cell division control protein 11
MADRPLGRTTFVNMLCGKNVLPQKESDDEKEAHVEQGTKIKPVTVGVLDRTVSYRYLEMSLTSTQK